MYKQLYFNKAPELIKVDDTGKRYIDIKIIYANKDCYGLGRYYEDNNVLITKGIYGKCRPSTSAVFKQRYRLKLGLSIERGELQKEILCGSPSAAACIITGNPSNGWLEWKDTKGREIMFYTYDNESTEPSSKITEQGNDKKTNIIYCNIGWMKYYNGITDDDKITDGGAYINFNGHGGEVDNFSNNNGFYFGYVRASINDRIDIQSHFSDIKRDTRGQNYIDNTLVVWVAHRKIIGFYFNATVYEFLQPLLEKYSNGRELDKANIISQRAILIPEKDREFIVSSIGQSNIWYGNTGTNELVIRYAQELKMRDELEQYLSYYKEYGKPKDIDLFIKSPLAKEILRDNSQLYNELLESHLNKYWDSLLKNSGNSLDFEYRGGYDFYYYLSRKIITDEDSLRQFIEEYEVPNTKFEYAEEELVENVDDTPEIEEPDILENVDDTPEIEEPDILENMEIAENLNIETNWDSNERRANTVMPTEILKKQAQLTADAIMNRLENTSISVKSNIEKEVANGLGIRELDSVKLNTGTKIVLANNYSLDNLKNILKLKHFLLLIGVPGTGKTTIAQELCRYILGKDESDQVLMLSFNGSTDYSDIVGGIRLLSNDEWGLKTGELTNLCNIAKENTDKDYIVIIDEINRGNTTGVLGEYITAMSQIDKEIKTNIGINIKIPSNVYIIATMNTFDASIVDLDDALINRFAQVRLDSNGFKAADIKPNASYELIEAINKTIEAINKINSILKEDTFKGEDNIIGMRNLYTEYNTIDELKLIIDTCIKPNIKAHCKNLNDNNINEINKTLKRLENDLNDIGTNNE